MVVASAAMASGASVNDVASEFSAAAVPPAGGPAKARFTGAARAFRKLMIRGALLQVVTLGIYRFWLTTDARRFLWANTEIDGDSLEYTGTAIELFLGFLIAIALLVPVYVLFFVGTLDARAGQPALQHAARSSSSPYSANTPISARDAIGSPAPCFAACASIRPDRPRNMRCVRSCGWCWSLWHARPRLSVGAGQSRALQALAHLLRRPARLVRGQRNVGCSSAASCCGCYSSERGSAAVAILATVDGQALSRATRAGRPDAAAGVAGAIIVAVAVGGMIVGIFVYTTLQAIVLRWWLDGLRFGPVVVATTLKKRQVVGAYLRCFLFGYCC